MGLSHPSKENAAPKMEFKNRPPPSLLAVQPDCIALTPLNTVVTPLQSYLNLYTNILRNKNKFFFFFLLYRAWQEQNK